MSEWEKARAEVRANAGQKEAQDKPAVSDKKCEHDWMLIDAKCKGCSKCFATWIEPSDPKSKGPYEVFESETGEYTYDTYVTGPGLTNPKMTVNASWVCEDIKNVANIAYTQGRLSMQDGVEQLKADEAHSIKVQNEMAEKMEVLSADLAGEKAKWEKLRKYCSGNSGEGWSYILQFMDKLEAQ